MIDLWNTPRWKAKSKRNRDIRTKSSGIKHTLGSQSYVTAKRKVAQRIGRELLPHEMWKQSHCRKGSRTLDKDLSCSSSLVSNVDSGGNVEEENLEWVDDRAEETWVKYTGYLVEKYGDDERRYDKKYGDDERIYDKELWERAGGGGGG